MKIPFQTNVLLLYNKFLSKGSYKSPLMKISSSGKGAKRILFFLPSEKIEAQLVSHLIKRNNKNKSTYFKFVVHQDSLTFYKNVPIIETITYTDNDLNWLGGIKANTVLQRIGDQDYDALVDLNQSYDNCLSLLSLQLKIPIKVGFQSPISDILYTVIIKPINNSFLEKNYHTIEKILNIHPD